MINQINNSKYSIEMNLLQSYYNDFQHKIPDIGKQEVISNLKTKAIKK